MTTPPRTPLTVQDITDDPLVRRVNQAAGEAAAETKFVQQRRNSLAGAANLVLQLVNILAFVELDIPLWGTVAIAVIIGLAEIIIHATSKTPVTPEVVKQVTEKARDHVAAEKLAEWETSSESNPGANLPTYQRPE